MNKNKLEKMGSSLFETNKESKVENLQSIIGGAVARTKRSSDCNPGNPLDGADTKYRKDSTIRKDDGCNEPTAFHPGDVDVQNDFSVNVDSGSVLGLA
jgi:hypothetical protein